MADIHSAVGWQKTRNVLCASLPNTKARDVNEMIIAMSCCPVIPPYRIPKESQKRNEKKQSSTLRAKHQSCCMCPSKRPMTLVRQRKSNRMQVLVMTLSVSFLPCSNHYPFPFSREKNKGCACNFMAAMLDITQKSYAGQNSKFRVQSGNRKVAGAQERINNDLWIC